jgi:hypothetical protein
MRVLSAQALGKLVHAPEAAEYIQSTMLKALVTSENLYHQISRYFSSIISFPEL